MDLTANLSFNLTALLNKANDFGAGQQAIKFPFVGQTLANGTAINQVDVVYCGKHTIAGGGNTTLDIRGVLTNLFAESVDPAKICGLAIYNSTLTVGVILEVGAAASNAWEGWCATVGAKEKIGPGGVWFKWEPSLAAMAVTAGTADQLKIANTGGSSADVYVMLLGRSA